jgi:hypothetical protein
VGFYDLMVFVFENFDFSILYLSLLNLQPTFLTPVVFKDENTYLRKIFLMDSICGD